MIDYIINELEYNKTILSELLKTFTGDMVLWKPAPEKWCALEIACHLIDEERFDFRFRTQWTLERPAELPPSIDPNAWINNHKYMEQDYAETIQRFIDERTKSINWLSALSDAKWENYYDHPKMGPLSARLFLNNWLAHDYLHIRQLLRMKFAFLETQSDTALDYAGNW